MRVQCFNCLHSIDEQKALRSWDAEDGWWVCKPCATKILKEQYEPLADAVYTGENVLMKVLKKRAFV